MSIINKKVGCLIKILFYYLPIYYLLIIGIPDSSLLVYK